jgi:N-acetylglucosamine-6-phosphate deacetylase
MSRQSEIWLAPRAIHDGQKLRRNTLLAVRDGRTGAILTQADLPAGARVVPLGGVLTAGFLDLQVNGGGDALLNNDQSVGALRTMAAAHRQFGTVGILPTVITDAPEVLARAVDAAIAARGTRGILGLHIEGPHLSSVRRGTHAAQWVRPFDDSTMGHIRRLRSAGIFVKITLAPEAVKPGQVAAVVRTGAVVSIGHSDATSRAVGALLAEGASCFTHLFNAMSQMQGREPGVAGAAINSTAYTGIICDGVHVADEMIDLALRARPIRGRMFLVSDAMSTVGGSDRFSLYGQQMRLQGGRLVNAEGNLAGAHVTMAEGLRRLITVVGVAPRDALDMAVGAPARLVGRPDLASPAGRDASDVILLDARWTVSATADDLVRSLPD